MIWVAQWRAFSMSVRRESKVDDGPGRFDWTRLVNIYVWCYGMHVLAMHDMPSGHGMAKGAIERATQTKRERKFCGKCEMEVGGRLQKGSGEI